jgi:hypothetical protein
LLDFQAQLLEVGTPAFGQLTHSGAGSLEIPSSLHQKFKGGAVLGFEVPGQLVEALQLVFPFRVLAAGAELAGSDDDLPAKQLDVTGQIVQLALALSRPAVGASRGIAEGILIVKGILHLEDGL